MSNRPDPRVRCDGGGMLLTASRTNDNIPQNAMECDKNASNKNMQATMTTPFPYDAIGETRGH